MNLLDIVDEDLEQLTILDDIVSKIYTKLFQDSLSDVPKMYEKLKRSQNSVAITDSELEWILTTLPLRLYDIAEAKSRLDLHVELLKLYIKETELSVLNNSEQANEQKRREEAYTAVHDAKQLVQVYTSVLERVESEISFSRELIMGAKKIWDSRRAEEQINPVGEVTSSLPEYEKVNKTYIK